MTCRRLLFSAHLQSNCPRIEGKVFSGRGHIALVVPSHDYGPVEDVHMILDHILTSYLYETLRRQSETTAARH